MESMISSGLIYDGKFQFHCNWNKLRTAINVFLSEDAAYVRLDCLLTYAQCPGNFPVSAALGNEHYDLPLLFTQALL